MVVRRNRSLIAPDWLTLRIVSLAAETGSLSQAARECAIATSAAARRVQVLEEECGVALLERLPRGVRATAAGEAFLRHAASLTEVASRLTDDMRAFAAGGGGSVRLHATTSAIVGHGLPAVLAAFSAAHPRIQVEMHERTSAVILHDVAEGRADLGIVTSGGTVPAGLKAHPWRDDRLFAVMKRDHPLAAKSSVKFAEVLEHPLVGAIEGGALSHLLAREAERLGRALRYRFRVAGTDASRSLIAAGLGVGVVPEGMWRPFARENGLVGVPLSEPWAERRLHLVTLPPERMLPPARLLRDHLLGGTHPPPDENGPPANERL